MYKVYTNVFINVKIYTHKYIHWNKFIFKSKEIIIDKVLMKKSFFLRYKDLL